MSATARLVLSSTGTRKDNLGRTSPNWETLRRAALRDEDALTPVGQIASDIGNIFSCDTAHHFELQL